MTDKELIELAAKAAGLDTPRYVTDGFALGWTLPNGISTESGLTSQRLWNPLTDDGDALRLAVRINRLDLLSVLDDYGDADLFNKDPCAATRRAIVRAAAEIGKAMP